jgi:multidrug efflux pump subunit AcrA (membrane-fusion protein)
VVLAAGVVLAARGRNREPAQGPPFRLGLVQAEDLQVSVRDVGVVDPATKVDVKGSVSGLVTAVKVREGDTVRRGQLLAEVEPDVNQAQTLAAVQAKVASAEVKFNHAERDFLQQAALYRQGLISDKAYRAAKVERDLAEEARTSARADFQIVEDRGIPIRGKGSAQLARISAPMDGVVIKKEVEPGDTITSGVSNVGVGTVLSTVAGGGVLSVMLISCADRRFEIGLYPALRAGRVSPMEAMR